MSDTSHTPQAYLIDDADPLVLLDDPTDALIYANPACLKAGGYERNELKGTQTARMMHKDNPPQVIKNMVFAIGSKQSWDGIIKNRRKTGDCY